MSKHTPGPWAVNANGNVKTSTGTIFIGPGRTYAEAMADARLIAAAPELLDALKALCATARTFRNVPMEEQDWTPIDDEALAAGFAAIAKASD